MAVSRISSKGLLKGGRSSSSRKSPKARTVSSLLATGTRKRSKLGPIVFSKPPVVEVDTTVGAAYIYLTNKPVHHTEVISESKYLVTVDRDAENIPVGIELIGVKDFTIANLLKLAGVEQKSFPNFELLAKTRYLAATG